ncbi:MAG TPA: low temperature requirement protein A [Chitinophagaceae bacterium]|nr:low temperature requirement protein A [Chitinophagaceae bacterium]
MANKHTNLWWGPPRNFDERKNERKISWLELFYDLVYVAAISQLTHHLAEHPSWAGAGYTFLLFSLVFWSWVNGSQYYDLHGNDSIRTRLFTFLQMLAVAAVAISVQDAYEGHHRGFAISFICVQVIVTYLWWSIGLYDRSHRVFNKFYTFNYIISMILLIISIFCDSATATILWVIVLLFNLTPALIGAGTIVRVLRERSQVFTASAALVERFGLFTIIVLAESILGTVTGIAEVKDKTPVAWVAFLLGIFIAFLLWSLYFDMTSEQETKQGYGYLQWLIFLHFPLLACLGIMGACIKVLLSNIETGLPHFIPWMFCIALAVILFMIAAISGIMKEEEEDRSYIRPVSRLLIATGIVILFIPFLASYLKTLYFLIIISAILFIPVFVGIRSWVRFKFFST